jgi:7,8-dihydro-6-hydroxymethylpterin-pyrophosphokinase
MADEFIVKKGLKVAGITYPNTSGTAGNVLTSDGLGNIIWASLPSATGLTDVVQDITPQLGGDFDVQNHKIYTSTTNGNILLEPAGTGSVIVKGTLSGINATSGSNVAGSNLIVKAGSGDGTGVGGNLTLSPGTGSTKGSLYIDGSLWPSSYGTNGQVLTTNGSGVLTWATPSGSTTNTFTTVAVVNGTTTNLVADTTSDTLTITAGTNITLSANATTDSFTINATGEANQNAFSNIAISGQTTVAADNTTDTLTLVAGTGITLTTDATNDSITITSPLQNTWATVLGNTGTTTANIATDSLSILGGTQIATAISGDTLTINYTGSGEANQNAFSNVAISGQTTVAADNATDTLTLVAGTGITLTSDATTDSITISSTASTPNVWSTISANTGSTTANVAADTLYVVGGAQIATAISGDTLTINYTGTSQNTFSTVAVSGQSNVVADNATDTLTLVAGTGISLTTDATTDSITITATGTTGGSGVTVQDEGVSQGTATVLNFVGSGVTASTTSGTTTVSIPGGGSSGGGSMEWVELYFTSGSSGNLSAADAILSKSSGVTATVSDGANSVVTFTFTGKNYPPMSIVSYGLAYGTNEFNINMLNANIGTRKVSGGGTASAPTLWGGTFNHTITLALTMSNVGASASIGQRSRAYVAFYFSN